MKEIKLIKLLFLTLILFSGSGVAKGQQVIGSFPYMNGGFEGQTAGSLSTTISSTNWTRQSQSGASSSIITTSPRSGAQYATVTSASSASRNLQSPQGSSGGPLANTSYVIQFYVRNASTVNGFQGGVSVNGTSNPTYSTATTLSANATWAKQTFVLTTTNITVTSNGLALPGRSTAGTFDIDDVVVYAGSSVDNIAPNSPSTVTVGNATTSSMDVSWGAASGGFDGGGYVVVRYSTSPNTDNDPNQNGIYAVGNTITNGTGSLTGTVRYIGTGTSFTDDVGLSAGTTYYYKVYTVDKAFNYSTESQGNGTTSSGETPTITVSTSSLTGFTYVQGSGPSSEQTFTISGSNLTEDISLAASTNYEISKTSGTGYETPLTFTHTGGTVSSTTVYIRLKAGLTTGNYNSEVLTASSDGASDKTVTLSGNVTAPPSYGLQITNINSDYLIDFDNTVQNVNNGQFSGSGFSPNPNSGQLNSDAFAVTGWSDGILSFGGTRTTSNTDYTRGSSMGNVSTGGVYAFEVSTGNKTLGIQPGGSDWAPGTITLRSQNKTNEVISSVLLSFIVYVRNDQGRSSSLNFSYSSDDSEYITVSSLDLVSEEVVDASPTWKAYYRTIKMSDLSLANNDYLYLRWSGADVGGSGSRDEFALDDITIRANPSINKIVSGSYYDFATAPSSTVELAPSTKLNVTSKLHNDGSIIIKSNDTGTATLLYKGSISGTGSATVQQYLTNQSWYITSPVTGTVTPTNLTRIQGYNEGVGTGNDWSVSGTTMTAGKGYIVSVASAPNTIEFNGNLNGGEIGIPLTRQAVTDANKYGFNLIGNPYPAYLDWTAVAAANASKMPTATMWYRTRVSGSWSFSTVNGLGGVATPANVSYKIPPMQAFWVRASTVGNSTLNLTPNMLVDEVNSNNKLKAPASANSDRQMVRLQISNAINADELVIYTDPFASDSFDRYDSPKMSNDHPDIPEISTIVGSESLVINGLNSIQSNMTIPVRFVTKTANVFTFKANTVSNLAEGVKLILKDYGNEFDLTDGAEYTFSSDVTDTSNRFSLVFRAPSVTTSVDELLNASINIYSINNRIGLKFNSEISNASVTVYNATGQSIHSQDVVSPATVLNKSLDAGVYVLKVTNGGRTMVLRTIVY